jgi:hypothetical protein
MKVVSMTMDGTVGRTILRLFFGLLLTGMLIEVGHGQELLDVLMDDVEDASESVTNSFDRAVDQAAEVTGDGPFDLRARTGHLAMETFGRNSSITHFELLPIVSMDDSVLFGDLRMFVDNFGEVGGNAGLGYRAYLEEWDRVIGASVWYDADHSTGELFHQAGFSLETWTNDVDLLANVYVPVSDRDKVFSRQLTNEQFSGNQLLFDEVRRVGEAMPGVDLTVGLAVPGDLAAEHDLRVYAGWYHFEGDTLETIDGYRLRARGYINDQISAQIEFTDDNTFGSNVIIGGSIVLPGSVRTRGSRGSARQFLKRFPQRNYNIIVPRATLVQSGIAAVNAATGLPFAVQHVSGSGNAGTAGTDVDPLSTFAEAQAASPDILFVHADSTFTEGITLQDGQFLLAETAAGELVASGFGTIQVPTVTNGTTAPILAGDAITLASNTLVSGFTINSPTLNGITGMNVGNIDIRNTSVQNAGGDGVFLQNLTGPATLSGVTLADATGASLHINGTAADVTVSGAITNSTGRSVLIENTTDDTLVDLSGATIQDSGRGLLISNVAGDVRLNDVGVTASTGSGITVSGGTGEVAFNGLTTVNTNAGPGIDVQNALGTVFFNNIDVTTDAQTGLFARTNTNLLIANGTINATNGGAAADIEDSAIDIRLASVFSDGGTFGLRSVNNTGTLGVLGTGEVGSGGSIQNATTGVLLENAGTTVLQSVDFGANATVLSDSGVGSDRVSVAGLRVTDTTGAAAFVTNNTRTLEIVNSTFATGTGVVLAATADTVDSYTHLLSGNVVTDSATDAFQITSLAGAEGSSLELQILNNNVGLATASTFAADVNWNGILAATVSGNTFTGAADMNQALRFTTPSTTDLATVAVTNNFFQFEGNSSVGVGFASSGPAQLTVDSNTFDFNGSDGTGMLFTLNNEAATVTVSSNVLTDDGSRATAVEFTTIPDLSSVALFNNLFQFNGTSGVDRGVNFTAIEAGGTISLSGDIDNVITNATTPFFVPVGQSAGQFPVNGVLVP